MAHFIRACRTVAAAALAATLLAACGGSAGRPSAYEAADMALTAPNPGGGPANPFLANGRNVLRALDAIEAKSGGPLRVTTMTADQANGLSVDVQEPSHHVNVDRYVVAPDGSLAGPRPVQLMSLNGGPITAASVDAQAFDPRRVAFARLEQTARQVIARSGAADARVSTWEIDGVGRDDKRFLYLTAERARPVAEVRPDLSIVRVQF